jgi:hypothetical protein
MGREAAVLTSVATGHSAGVGVEWWRGSSAGKKTRAAARRRGRRGSRGSRRSHRRRVRLLPRAAPSSRRATPPTGGSSSPSPPLLSLLPGGSMGGQGSNSPRRLGLGFPPGLCGGSYSGARRGTRAQLGCAGRRAARRDGEAHGRHARLWLWSSAKAQR